MTIKIDFDPKKIEKKYRNRASDVMVDSMHDLKNSIDKHTPELTMELIENNEVYFKDKNNIIEIWVVNETEYANIVEEGEWKVYDYHKYNGATKVEDREVIHTGKWAYMFEKWLEERKGEKLQDLLDKL